ncbi:MAG: translocation/assembly module TamB domain-containing protein, partial [Gemmatimonadales bacterium]
MRTVRRIVAALLTPLAVVIAVVIGTVAATVLTPPGHALLARIASRWISGAIAGGMQIGAIRGNIWSHIELDHVVIRDQSGRVLLSTPRLETSYVLPGLLARRLIFRHVRADSLVLHLVKLRAGRWNYEAVFHLNEGPGSGQPPPRVALLDVGVTHGSIQIDVPTTPGPPRRPVTRNGRTPSQPRVDTTADGPVRVYTMTDLDATLSLLRISTPNHDPLEARVVALRTRINDPAVELTQMTGRILTAGDSLRFAVDSISMPGSRLIGGGAIRWPHDTLLFDFTLDAPKVALRDLRWIQADLPDWTGRGHVIAKSASGSRADFLLDHLAVGNDTAGVTGKMTVMTDVRRGFGMGGLDLQLRRTPIDILRPYLDTLPVSGTLTGHLLANGFLDALHLGGDLVFADALVPGAPTSHLVIDGLVHFGGNEGAVFERFRFSQSALALATIHHLVPSILLTGDLDLTGTLDGPWKNFQFAGTAEHVAPGGALSRMLGVARLDTRGAVLGLGLNADFDRLSFDALRSGYPDLPSQGGLTGHVVANGTLDHLDVDAHLTGEVGTIAAVGQVTVDAPHYGADSLVMDLQRFDVEAALGSGMSTSLNGRVTVRGTMDVGVPPSGTLAVALDRSRFGGATVDAVTGVVHADHGMLAVDTGVVVWNAGRVDAHGTLGWAAPDSGMLTVQATVTSLTPFDSLIRAKTGVVSDTINPHPFDGHATASLVIAGAKNSATVTGTVNGSQILLDTWHASDVNATLRADSLGRRGFRVDLTADSIGKGAQVAQKLHLVVAGKSDSLAVGASVSMVALDASVGGTWQPGTPASRLRLDSLSLAFPHQTWHLASPLRIRVAAPQIALLDTFRLRSANGEGEVVAIGTLPGDTPGTLDARVRGLHLLDVFGVLERDTTSLDGLGALDLHLAGTRDHPTFTGSATVTSPVIDGAYLPTVRATFDYAGTRLRSDVSLWRTGRAVLSGSVSLPLDLALNTRVVRKLPGELEINAKGDSVDMSILTAMIPTVRNPTGMLQLDLHGSGSWNVPELTGSFAVHDGGMTIPSLGSQRYGPINGSARFVADSMVIDSLEVGTAESGLRVKGSARFAKLATPSLDLDIGATDFLAIDVPADMTLRATGNMHLSGPLLQPVLTGDDVTLSRSVVYFTDILNKTVVDLEDPENAALIDTTALRRQGLGNQFSIRFLDSLTINGLGVHIGSDVWLRSTEANIQLEGDLVVDKQRKVYGLTGLLSAPRGSYTLDVGFIKREFSVDQGTIRYYGTPDLNPDLSITAHNQVRTIDGDQFNV